MRFLIPGARGLLGAEWVRALTPAHEGVATDLPEVDLTDRAAASACVAESAPDWILHGAASTAVDQAGSEPERGDAANMLVAWKCCRRVTGSGRRNWPGMPLAKVPESIPLDERGVVWW
jgi:dTDP-4-dehydrorhamnose reductase